MLVTEEETGEGSGAAGLSADGSVSSDLPLPDRRWVAYVEFLYPLALLLISLGVTFMVRAGFGISVASSVAYIASLAFPAFSFGTWSYLVMGLLMLALTLVTRKPRIGVLLSFGVSVVFGVLVDRFSAWVAPWPDGIPIQLLYYAVGITLLTVGIAVFIDTGLPPNPYERFVSDLSRHFGIPFRKVKTVYDLASVATASLLLLLFVRRLVGIGPGTVFAALANGTLIGFWLRLLVRRVSVRSLLFPARYVRPVHALARQVETANK
ncbi:MAG: hypothetical protein GX153_03435 [Clostridiaceae bacterium]|nr:hypothetical protein [Clostridiaceae bacterium]